MLIKRIKHNIINKLGQLAWLALNVFVMSIIAGTALYVLAAFTEPTTAPSASDQDFAENILGANNANNDFSSALVDANAAGSIIERLEYIEHTWSATTVNMTVSDYVHMIYQVYDDWNCANNNATSDSACGASDSEYAGEEGAWTSATDADISNASTTSGTVKKDGRTGLYWSDAYDANADGTEDTISNSFTIGTGCSDADINNGNCDSSIYQTKGNAITFCEDLLLDSDGDTSNESDWRLPTQKELMIAYANGAANNLPKPDRYYW